MSESAPFTITSPAYPSVGDRIRVIGNGGALGNNRIPLKADVRLEVSRVDVIRGDAEITGFVLLASGKYPAQVPVRSVIVDWESQGTQWVSLPAAAPVKARPVKGAGVAQVEHVARRGDLVVVETVTHDYVVGRPSQEPTPRFDVYMVSGVHRDGSIAKITDLSWADGAPYDLKRVCGFRQSWVVSADKVDMPATLAALRAHKWPGHYDSSMIMPWDSLADVRAMMVCKGPNVPPVAAAIPAEDRPVKEGAAQAMVGDAQDKLNAGKYADAINLVNAAADLAPWFTPGGQTWAQIRGAVAALIEIRTTRTPEVPVPTTSAQVDHEIRAMVADGVLPARTVSPPAMIHETRSPEVPTMSATAAETTNRPTFGLDPTYAAGADATRIAADALDAFNGARYADARSLVNLGADRYPNGTPTGAPSWSQMLATIDARSIDWERANPTATPAPAAEVPPVAETVPDAVDTPAQVDTVPVTAAGIAAASAPAVKVAGRARRPRGTATAPRRVELTVTVPDTAPVVEVAPVVGPLVTSDGSRVYPLAHHMRGPALRPVRKAIAHLFPGVSFTVTGGAVATVTVLSGAESVDWARVDSAVAVALGAQVPASA